eukprot:TRINITY_DN1232_c0_g1_i1.p1 TRINITY_DN1232_c0_g1~~TRINITY_DN1232_c0_g1_i1.p1  ORF type:complete len:462 (+),score=121.53 TRINITY_DN1232_c0_g1_i1:134-1387(+)
MATSTRRRFASRMDRLGTETAYAVAEEAQALAKTGAKVYSLHIGDINIPTPKVVCEAVKKAVDEGKTGYCSAQGILPLKEALATYLSESRSVRYSTDQISVQPGGKPTIAKFLMSVMEDGDEVLYPTPGYPIYESQINFVGGSPKPYIYRDNGRGFEIDLDYLRSQITDKTRVLIYNNYQNPIGCASSDEEMEEIAKIAVENDLWVLSDEAYFQLVYAPYTPKSIVSLPGMFERTLLLYTFSKEFSMTGWRLGAAAGPKDLIRLINKLNTNLEACTTHFVQYAGITALTHPEAKEFTEKLKGILQERRDLIVKMANEVPGFKAYSPHSSFYLLVNVTEAMKLKGITDVEEFRRTALQQTGVSFCTREHFGSSLAFENQKYVRFAFSSADCDTIREAFQVLRKWMTGSADIMKGLTNK